MTFQELQSEFMKAAKQPIGKLSKATERESPSEATRLYFNLIGEEYNELEEAFFGYEDASMDDEKMDAICECAKELADMIYVICGFASSIGIPLEDIFAEVHRSNMTKFTVVGDRLELVKREDGKVLKPASYREANIRHIIQTAIVRELTPKTLAELEELQHDTSE